VKWKELGIQGFGKEWLHHGKRKGTGHAVAKRELEWMHKWNERNKVFRVAERSECTGKRKGVGRGTEMQSPPSLPTELFMRLNEDVWEASVWIHVMTLTSTRQHLSILKLQRGVQYK
jgi:hypothetical protein